MAMNGRHAAPVYFERRPFVPDIKDDERFSPIGLPNTLGQLAPRASSVEPPALHWHRDTDPNANRAWLIKDLVPETGKGLLSGQWGSGKTFGVLDLSLSVMTGRPFAGRRNLRRGGVLFVAPEGASEIPVRLRGLVAGRISGEMMSDATEGRATVDPDDLPFAWIEECPRLLDAEAIKILMGVAKEAAELLRERYGLPLALIVIDTVAAGAGFDDENSAAETQKVMGTLERLSAATGAFVFGVDHFGKATETGTRGSSAKEAAADVVLAMLANRDEAGNVSNTRMAVRKLRGGRIGMETPYNLEPIEIGRDCWGDPITTCVVAWNTDRTSQAATAAVKECWSGSLKVFKAAMQNALAEHSRKVRPFGAEGPEITAVQSIHVRNEFSASYATDGDTPTQRTEAKRKAFQRAVKNAQSKGLIIVRELGGTEHFWFSVDE
jgi:hypothetical protein